LLIEAYEMYVAGYRFLVLNNVFMNHWGLQRRESRPKWRHRQQLLNNRSLPFVNYNKQVCNEA
jgi:hypothetical protein